MEQSKNRFWDRAGGRHFTSQLGHAFTSRIRNTYMAIMNRCEIRLGIVRGQLEKRSVGIRWCGMRLVALGGRLHVRNSPITTKISYDGYMRKIICFKRWRDDRQASKGGFSLQTFDS
jgi:hypothetical protein